MYYIYIQQFFIHVVFFLDIELFRKWIQKLVYNKNMETSLRKVHLAKLLKQLKYNELNGPFKKLPKHNKKLKTLTINVPIVRNKHFF